MPKRQIWIVLLGIALLCLVLQHVKARNRLHNGVLPAELPTVRPTGAPTWSDANSTIVGNPGSLPSDILSFWFEIVPILLEDARPQVPNLPFMGPGTGIEAKISPFATLPQGYNRWQDLIHLSDRDIRELRNAHGRFLAGISGLTSELPYKAGSKGIVTTASGSFLPILVVSLQMLRRTGSDLPVEVFLESMDVYEPDVCEVVLPTLGAQCFVLEQALDDIMDTVRPKRYQLKPFAILFSSFEDVLFLDADNIVLDRPEGMLSSEPFVSRGLVTWPDYWANTASLLFYSISSTVPPPPITRAASESGQLLISKSKHLNTLLLSLYYNVYGPTHYYSLLSQGAIGQGDKETFLAAAIALNAPFYDVRTKPEEVGFTEKGSDGSKTIKGAGTLQANPFDDFNLSNTPQSPRFVNSNSDEQTFTGPSFSFLHAQAFKLDAAALPSKWHAEIQTRMWGPAKELDARLWGPRPATGGEAGIRDLEHEVWEEMLQVACLYEDVFLSWQDRKAAAINKDMSEGGGQRRLAKENGGSVCAGVEKVVRLLFGR